MFTPRILKGASRELERLDPAVARRLVDRIRWLAENIENIRPEPLKGDFAGFFKLREGDYRVVYEILHKERLLVIHSVGHRSKIYNKRK